MASDLVGRTSPDLATVGLKHPVQPVGVGKTMIAQALGHAACRRGYSAASPSRRVSLVTWLAAMPTERVARLYTRAPAPSDDITEIASDCGGR